MVRRGSIGVLLVLVLGVGATADAKRVTVTPSRADLLYAQTQSPDCTELSKAADGALPLYVVRIRATPPVGVPPSEVRYEWQLPVPNVGAFAADLDLGPDEEASVVKTLCADVGNECLLTAEQLAVYNQPTILWVAPTCEVLPSNTSTQYRGASVRLGVRAFRGKRRIGRGKTSVSYGRLGSLTLLVADPGGQYRDGIGKPGGEKIFINPTFGVRFDPSGATLPAVKAYDLDSGGGGAVILQEGCGSDPTLTACTDPNDILYTAGGKQLATVSAELGDGSALCDKLTVDIRTTTITAALEVTASPAGPYKPGESVDLRVRLRNTSPPGSNGNILLAGQVLSCVTEVQVGASTLSKTHQIDLQHCSATIEQACESDADCGPGQCDDCEPNEVCLTSDHCTTRTIDPLGCVSDRDCRPPRCSLCSPDDRCVKVLPVSSIFLGVGDSVDLLESRVTVDNLLPSPARVTDTWTASTVNAGSETDVLKYTIGKR